MSAIPKGMPPGLVNEFVEWQEEDRRNRLSDIELLREDNPALADAWEQIKIIRETITANETKNCDATRTLSWEKMFYANANSGYYPELDEAWDRYYVLKGLLSNA